MLRHQSQAASEMLAVSFRQQHVSKMSAVRASDNQSSDNLPVRIVDHGAIDFLATTDEVRAESGSLGWLKIFQLSVEIETFIFRDIFRD
jgi:hypothetical protein